MSDQFQWWRDALAGKFGPIHEGDPQSGFYRLRVKKGGGFVPVAVWRDDLGLEWCLINGETAKADEKWTFYCRHPITRELYDAVMAGGAWPDDEALVRSKIAALKARDGGIWPDDAEAVSPGVGHNEPPDDAALVLSQIEALKARLADYACISDDDQQASAQSLRSRFLELSREADKKREAEKKPHFEAGKAVDAKWQPAVKDAKEAADVIARAMSSYETEKARKAERERQRAEEARIKAEAARREAERANMPPPLTPDPVPEPEAAPIAPIKGAYGRAASVKVVKIATVVDQDAAYAAMRTHPELVDLIAKLAQRAVNAGHKIAGVSVTEERKVA